MSPADAQWPRQALSPWNTLPVLSLLRELGFSQRAFLRVEQDVSLAEEAATWNFPTELHPGTTLGA